MYYRGANPSALRSRGEITATFMKLLETRSLADLSVKQIMDATDLTRQTYYQIFDSKEDILEYYLDSVLDELIRQSRQHVINDLCAAAKVFLPSLRPTSSR